MTAKTATDQQPTKISAADVTRLRKLAATAIDTAATLVTAASLYDGDWTVTAVQSIRALLRTDGVAPETAEYYAIDREFHLTVASLEHQASRALVGPGYDSPTQQAMAAAHAAAACESAEAVVYYAAQAVRDAAGHDIGEWNRARVVASAQRGAELLDEYADACRRALKAVRKAADVAQAEREASR